MIACEVDTLYMKLPLICSFFYVDVIKSFPHLLTLINGNSIFFQGLFSREKSHLLRLSLPIQLLCQFFENFERAGQEGSDNNDCDSNSDETQPYIKMAASIVKCSLTQLCM